MDIKKMQAILMARGTRISDDDPLFILLALNEVVLEEMTKKHQQTFNDVNKKVVEKLSAIVNQTVSQIAGKEAEARAAIATTKKAIWMIGGGLAGLAMFGLGVSYGATYSTWTNPLWINRTGLLSVLSSALLKAPVGGVGCIAIALTLVFLQINVTDLMVVNEADEPVLKILVYLFAAAFAAMGLWLNFLVMV